MADSWLTDGNCNNCRRKNYCSSRCKKARVREKRQMYNDVMEATGLGELLDKDGNNEKLEKTLKAPDIIE